MSGFGAGNRMIDPYVHILTMPFKKIQVVIIYLFIFGISSVLLWQSS